MRYVKIYKPLNCKCENQKLWDIQHFVERSLKKKTVDNCRMRQGDSCLGITVYFLSEE